MSPQQTRARMQFLTWLGNNHPELYDAVIAKADYQNNALAGLGQDMGPPAPTVSGDSWWQKATGGLLALGTTYLSLKNQRDAMKLNLERAQQGLPPIDAGVTAPVIRTEIDLPPDVIDKLTAGAGTQVNKILLFGGAALLAFMLFMR